MPAAPVGLPRFGVRSGVTGLVPFAFGHPFRQGDVPAGSTVLGDCADWQCSPLTSWPDGSLKHAIVAGRVIATAGSEASIVLTAGTPSGGTALTEADLAAVLPATTVGVDGDVTSLNALIGTGARHTTVCTGPVMSSWVYRRPVAGSAHLVVFIEVRLFKGGAVEIFPWIENGYLLVAAPTNHVRTCSVSIGGVQRFSQTIDIKHHTRIPLITGAGFGYWVGTDPGLTPRHDRAYLLWTKLVPAFGWFDPPGSVLDALQQSYVPNTLAGDTSATGSAGGSGCVVSAPAAFYVTSGGDARAYRAMMVHALSSGSWSFHHRDENTNRPIRFSDWPNIRFGYTDLGQSNPLVSIGTGGENGNTYPNVSHLPSYAYLPFLVTGRWWLLEEAQFWATYAYMVMHRIYRGGAAGIHDTGQTRSRAWGLNVLAQAAAITPSSHPLYADLVASWQSNTDRHRRKYVDGTYTADGVWVSPQGFMGEYSAGGDSLYPPTNPSTAWWGAPWMSNYFSVVFGYTSDIGIPQSAQSLSDHIAVRNHAYKQQVQRADDGLNGRYNWRRFVVYALPVGSDASGLPPETWFTAAQSYQELLSGYGLASIPGTPGLTLKAHSSDNDLLAGTSSLTYGSTGLSALALAVEHRAPGAQAGWARVTGASNFLAAFGSYLTGAAPEWGIRPRVA